MENLTVSVIQMDLVWENHSENLSSIEKWLEKVPAETDLVVLPEMFSTGFSMNSSKLAEPMDGPTVEWLKAQCVKWNKAIMGSLIIKDGGNFFNRMIMCSPTGVESVYDKRHLFRMAEENQFFNGGEKRIIWNYKGWRICPQVCYDLRFPVWSRNQNDYDVLVYVANWPKRRNHPWKTLLLARAMENQSYVVGTNRVGIDANEIEYSGDSAIIDPMGNYCLQATPEKEEIITFELSHSFLEQCRAQFPVLLDRDQFTVK